MIGTNPRFEATMLNARIRKAYLNNKIKIISLNNVGDLTYPYQILNGKTQTIKDIIENKNEITNDILNSKKPLIVLGESFLKSKSANNLFYSLKEFLNKNNKFTQDWNPLNILSTDASTVGSIDLDLVDQNNNILDDLKQNKFEIIYLLNQDNLDFVKKDEFINEDLKVEFKDYYFSNVVARASKTMLDCNNSKIDVKRTGTEG